MLYKTKELFGLTSVVRPTIPPKILVRVLFVGFNLKILPLTEYDGLVVKKIFWSLVHCDNHSVKGELKTISLFVSPNFPIVPLEPSLFFVK